LRNPARLKVLGAKWLGYIVLAPFSTSGARNWSVESWLTLENILLKAGRRLVIVHDDLNRIERFRSEKLVTRKPEEVAACFFNASAVVAVESGPAHLAAMLHTRTIILCGATDALKYHFAPVETIYGHTSCVCCFWQPPHQPDCERACAAMWSISPDEVAEKMLQVPIDKRDLMAIAGVDNPLGEVKLRVLRQCVQRTNHLPGDVAEFGVYRGSSAELIATYMQGGRLHLFPNGWSDVAEVEQRVPDAVVHTAANVLLKFRFAHVDVESYEGTKEAIEYLATRMTAGGLILFDDWQWPRAPGVARAVLEKWPAGRIRAISEHQATVAF
jgi:hypothetical protein